MVRKQHKRRPLEERFWEKVDTSGKCWIWLGATYPSGYGHVWQGSDNVKDEYAHRAAWFLANGPIPKGKQVLHDCDTPPCVRLEHLYLGTPADNMRDRDTRGRNGKGNTHYQKDHKPDWAVSAAGNKWCRICKREYSRRYYLTHRERIRKYRLQQRRAKRKRS